jgi:hypothetical protein
LGDGRFGRLSDGMLLWQAGADGHFAVWGVSGVSRVVFGERSLEHCAGLVGRGSCVCAPGRDEVLDGSPIDALRQWPRCEWDRARQFGVEVCLLVEWYVCVGWDFDRVGGVCCKFGQESQQECSLLVGNFGWDLLGLPVGDVVGDCVDGVLAVS